MSDVMFIIGVNTYAYLLTKSNMAAVGHIGKVIFFVSYTILTFNTSNVTNFGMQNSLMMLFHHWGQYTCLFTKSNRAAVSHIGIVIFVSYNIFTCKTSKVINFGM